MVKTNNGGKKMNEKRFVVLDNEEVYYITDTKDLKSLNDYIKKFSHPKYEHSEEEALSAAKEEYWQMIYENSMSAKENVDMLNGLFDKSEQLSKKNLQLEEDLCYYSTKCASLETGMFSLERDNNKLERENEQLKSELSETKEILRSIERDRNQNLLICKKYEGFFKEKGFDIHDLIDYARDGSND